MLSDNEKNNCSIDYEKNPPIIYSDEFIEHSNIAWRIEHPVRLPQLLLEPDLPWESASPCSGHGTVLKDPIDGKYKAWVVAAEEDINYTRGNHLFRLVYLVSDDGLHWDRPELNVCSFGNHEKTNIIFDFDSGGRTTYASVFIDPENNPDEPYEMFCFRDLCFRNPGFCVEGSGQKPSDDINVGRERYGIYRYRSKDGIHWQYDHGPIDLKTGDTCNIHKISDGKYVCHHKDSVSMYPTGSMPYDVDPTGCRLQWYRTSEDGINWSQPSLSMVPDYHDNPGDQIMELGRYPYNDGFIGMTAVYHAHSQTMDMQFAASKTGEPLSWWRPIPRRACLPLNPLGDYGGGLIWPTRTLVEEGDELVLFYGACSGLHGDLYIKHDNCLRPFYGAMCRASWKKGRMWAAVPAAGGAIEGRLLTKPLTNIAGKQLLINSVTRSKGMVKAELLDKDRKAIPGFGLEDAKPVVGDHRCKILQWAGGDKCPKNAVHMRIGISEAILYGYVWQ